MSDERNVTSRLNVERDVHFVRFSADSSLMINLGRDVEISFLQNSPSMSAQLESEDGQEGYELEPKILEMARVRLAPNNAVALAFYILDELSQTGKMNPELLESSFSTILEKTRVARRPASHDSQSKEDEGAKSE